MKTKIVILIGLGFMLMPVFCTAQIQQELKEGESITVDQYGNVVGSKMATPPEQKAYDPMYFNSDGTIKVPGYTPTGNWQTDGPNYHKALANYYTYHPVDYQLLMDKIERKFGSVIHISDKEYRNLPAFKQDYFKEHPEKYILDTLLNEPSNIIQQ